MGQNLSLWDRFAFFRSEVLHMSQTAVAKQLGLSASAVSKWEKAPETGKKHSNEPSARILWKMICLFRLNPDWLFEGIGTPQLPVPPGIKNESLAQNTIQLSFQPDPLDIPLDRIIEVRDDLEAAQNAIARIRAKLNS